LWIDSLAGVSTTIVVCATDLHCTNEIARTAIKSDLIDIFKIDLKLKKDSRLE
jgi:hypothetical protein